MCGLCGEITFDGSTADTTAVARMVEALVPRGPDGQGSWSNGRVAFGHRRLSVIDLSTCGSQPMVDNDLGLTAVFNGCIYDWMRESACPATARRKAKEPKPSATAGEDGESTTAAQVDPA